MALSRDTVLQLPLSPAGGGLEKQPNTSGGYQVMYGRLSYTIYAAVEMLKVMRNE